MPTRKASAEWRGVPRWGRGRLSLGSGAFAGEYSFGSRFENAPGTSPEELLAAAQAGCFSMELARRLVLAGYQPRRIVTSARVELEKPGGDFSITRIILSCEGDVPKIAKDTFLELADQAGQTCPVSRALATLDIQLNARLVIGDHRRPPRGGHRPAAIHRQHWSSRYGFD